MVGEYILCLKYYVEDYVNRASVPESLSLGHFMGYVLNYAKLYEFSMTWLGCSIDSILAFIPVERRSEFSDFFRAFNSWECEYNTETSLYCTDILDIPEENFIVLGGIVYDIEELLACFQMQPDPVWLRSPHTNEPYPNHLLLEMQQHPRLVSYAQELRQAYQQETYIHPQILDALSELLQTYLSYGSKPNQPSLSYTDEDLEACTAAKTQFLLQLECLPDDEKDRFLDAIILVENHHYQPTITTVKNTLIGATYQCIMLEQRNLWVFLLTRNQALPFPLLLKNTAEAQGLRLPKGARFEEEGPATAADPQLPQPRRNHRVGREDRRSHLFSESREAVDGDRGGRNHSRQSARRARWSSQDLSS